MSSIENAAFGGCSGLTEITVDDLNTLYTSVAGVLFDMNRTTLIQYPAGKLGGDYTIPDTVISIGEAAFSGCTKLTGVTIPGSVTSVGYAAFEFCGRLANVTLPNTVTSIGGYAFAECSGLGSVTIGNRATDIESFAFHNCASLTSLTFPATVASIGAYACYGCSGLTAVYVQRQSPQSWFICIHRG